MMARQGKGIFDSFTGNVGVIQGARNRRKGIIRSKPRQTERTQTPELATTKTNFQIANEMYNLFLLFAWSKGERKEPKHKSERNQFVGEWVKILSKKENGFHTFNMFTPNFMYFKWRPRIWMVSNIIRIGVFFDLLPYPTKSKPTDRIVKFSYFGDTGRLAISSYNNSIPRTENWRESFLQITNDKKGVFVAAFLTISTDYKAFSNGIAGIVINH